MDDTPHPVRNHRTTPHYYGDIVRGLFLSAAIVILLGGFLGAPLPLPPILSIIFIVILVLIAGITNPLQRWVHWFNVFVSIFGILVFGGAVLSRYHTAASALTGGMFLTLLTLLFLISLYFATRTLRAFVLSSRIGY